MMSEDEQIALAIRESMGSRIDVEDDQEMEDHDDVVVVVKDTPASRSIILI
jgi:hypothetical protein